MVGNAVGPAGGDPAGLIHIGTRAKGEAMFTADDLRKVMLSAVGSPYVWGANGPGKFDCSGLVLWGWRKVGCDEKDTTAAYIYAMTKKVTGEYQVGDVVFLKNSSTAFNGIGHIAMLTKKLANGDWEVVEAKGRAYGVIVTSLSVWKRRKGYQPPRRNPRLKLAGAPAVDQPLNFRLVSWNILGRRFDTTGTWAKRKQQVINRLRYMLDDTTPASASVLVLTECGATEAAELGKALGMKHMTYLFTSILYSPAWTVGGTWKLTNRKGTHGTLIAEMKRDGRTVNVVATHLPPKLSAAGERKRLVAALLAKAAKWNDPTIWAGDFNSTTAVEAQILAAKPGWQSARRSATTLVNAEFSTKTTLKAAKLTKGRPIDYVFTRKVTARSYRVLRAADPIGLVTGFVRVASDHHAIGLQLTVG